MPDMDWQPKMQAQEASPLWADPAKAGQAAGQVKEILKADPHYVPALIAAAGRPIRRRRGCGRTRRP